MQSFTQQIDSIENMGQPVLFQPTNAKYSDYVTLEPSSVVQVPLLDMSQTPLNERCLSSPRLTAKKASVAKSLLDASESQRLKSARSVG